MSGEDFEDRVIRTLSSLSTQMTALVGRDGNGGQLQQLSSRVRILEDRSIREDTERRARGDSARATRGFWSAAWIGGGGALLAWAIDHLSFWRGH